MKGVSFAHAYFAVAAGGFVGGIISNHQEFVQNPYPITLGIGAVSLAWPLMAVTMCDELVTGRHYTFSVKQKVSEKQ